MAKTKKLNCCIARNGEEVKNGEFEVSDLKEFIHFLGLFKELHLKYFDGEEDLDLWVKIKTPKNEYEKCQICQRYKADARFEGEVEMVICDWCLSEKKRMMREDWGEEDEN